jgi:hypothetical protein
MSKSDSEDSLEFESADEGQNDLSDLSDLDEILNEPPVAVKKEPLKPQSAVKEQAKESTSKPELHVIENKPEKIVHDSAASKSEISQSNQQPKEVKLIATEPTEAKETTSKPELHVVENKPEQIVHNSTASKRETSQPSQQLKDTEEVKVIPPQVVKKKFKIFDNNSDAVRKEIVKTEKKATPVITTEIKQDELKPELEDKLQEKIVKKIDELSLNKVKPNLKHDEVKKEPTAPAKKVVSTGWDDNWDDLDENEDEKPADLRPSVSEKPKQPIPTSKSVPNIQPKSEFQQQQRADDSHKSIDQVLQRLVDKPKQQSSSGWNWSQLGTSFITSAVNLTSHVLETVETTLGAPDPAELAAQIAKSRSESQLEKSTASSSVKEDGGDEESKEKDVIKSDWDNEEQEWFSLPQLANKVN